MGHGENLDYALRLLVINDEIGKAEQGETSAVLLENWSAFREVLNRLDCFVEFIQKSRGSAGTQVPHTNRERLRLPQEPQATPTRENRACRGPRSGWISTCQAVIQVALPEAGNAPQTREWRRLPRIVTRQAGVGFPCAMPVRRLRPLHGRGCPTTNRPELPGFLKEAPRLLLGFRQRYGSYVKIINRSRKQLALGGQQSAKPKPKQNQKPCR
jgi:hypothetical protein